MFSPDSAPAPLKVFFSYCHKDERFRDELERHLGALRLTGQIVNWHDRRIVAGQEWRGQIDDNIEAADIILLLISSDFINSGYCFGIEMRRAIEKHRSRESVVIPIILRHVDFRGLPFANLQALPTDAIPVTETGKWPTLDAAFQNVAVGIRKTVEEVQKRRFNQSQSPHGTGESKAEAGGASAARGEAGYWEAVEASPLSADWKTKLRSFVRAAERIPGCEISWQRGLMVNLPGVVPKKTLVGVRRDGTLEVYLERWQPPGSLTERQQLKKTEFMNKLQTTFRMGSEDLKKQYPQIPPSRWLPKASEMVALIGHLARPEEPDPVEPPPSEPGAKTPRPITLPEDEFYELLGQGDAALPGTLRSFVAKAESIRVFADVRASVSLKYELQSGRTINLGVINKNRTVDFGYPSAGDLKSRRNYIERIAALIGGKVLENNKGLSWVKTAANRFPLLSDLLPQHEQAWLDAMEQIVQENSESTSSDES